MGVVRRKPGRPPRADVKRLVLAEAARRFAADGYERVTVEDLIQGAGVSRATFYKHFDGREDVLAALYKTEAEALRAHVVATLDEAGSFAEITRKSIVVYFRAIAERGPLYRELTRLSYANERMLALREEITAGYVKSMRAALKKRLGIDVPELLIDATLTAVDRVAQRTLARGPVSPARLEAVIDKGAEGIRTFLAAAFAAGMAGR
jgi:AcrR family transcriptional regulator